MITLLAFLLNAIIFASYFKSTALSIVNERLDLAVNFTQPIHENQVNSLTTSLKENFTEIRAIKYISSEEAYKNFLDNFQKANLALARWLEVNLEESPLPATLVISAEAKLHGEILTYLKTTPLAPFLDLPKLDSKNLSTTTADKIIEIDKTFSKLGWISALTFTVLAILIIAAVLRLAILARYSEITIMRLVGATKEFIRIPFILEGIFFATVATLVGALGFAFLVSNFTNSELLNTAFGNFANLFKFTSTDFSGAFPLLLSWQLIAAVLIGSLASIFATSKYLRKQMVMD